MAPPTPDPGILSSSFLPHLHSVICPVIPVANGIVLKNPESGQLGFCARSCPLCLAPWLPSLLNGSSNSSYLSAAILNEIRELRLACHVQEPQYRLCPLGSCYTLSRQTKDLQMSRCANVREPLAGERKKDEGGKKLDICLNARTWGNKTRSQI